MLKLVAPLFGRVLCILHSAPSVPCVECCAMSTLATSFKLAPLWQVLSSQAREGIERMQLTSVRAFAKCVGGAWEEYKELEAELDGSPGEATVFLLRCGVLPGHWPRPKCGEWPMPPRWRWELLAQSPSVSVWGRSRRSPLILTAWTWAPRLHQLALRSLSCDAHSCLRGSERMRKP